MDDVGGDPQHGWWLLFVTLLSLTAAMRLVELAVSNARLRRRSRSAVAEPWLFPLMATLHISLIVLPLFEVRYFHRQAIDALAAGCLALFILATLLRIWTLRTIGASWNVRVVAPEPGGVVTGGPYAWIRHPNYLAVILELVALPLLHTAWISALLLGTLNAVVLFFRIRTEEALLLEIPDWKRAMQRRARLIPGVF